MQAVVQTRLASVCSGCTAERPQICCARPNYGSAGCSAARQIDREKRAIAYITLGPTFRPSQIMLRFPTASGAAVALLGILVLKRFLRARGPPLPPGPRPLLGVLALPSGSDREWLTYAKWAEEYGEITSVCIFGQPLVVLNTFKAATEMLDKKSSIYSDRPVFQMSGELVRDQPLF
jgi:hypothetical protein